jgi:citrate lyase beta subunit
VARLRRSLLFVPGSDPRKLERSRGAGADTLIFDLEDAVAPAEKPNARRLVAGVVREADLGGAERTVRINATPTPDFAEDLKAVMAAGPGALVVPKVGSAEEIRMVDELVGFVERKTGRTPGSVKLLPLIETAAGVLNAAAIAAATPRVEALLMGHGDLSLSIGVKEARAGDGTILHARCQIVLAAKAAGKEAIDTVFLDIDDLEGFRAEARQGLRLGYGGKLLIHPSQVGPVHEVYTPSPAEVAYARRVVEAYEAALAEGRGVFALDRRMIDGPIVDAERTVLERARKAGVA